MKAPTSARQENIDRFAVRCDKRVYQAQVFDDAPVLHPSSPYLRSPTVDCDALHWPLRLGRFRQNHSEQAVTERGTDPVLVDIIHWNAALEAAVVALAEEPILVFSLSSFLAFDRKHAIRQLELDVFFVQAGQLSRHLHLFVGFSHLDTRPAEHAIEPAIKAQGSEIEPAKGVIE